MVMTDEAVCRAEYARRNWICKVHETVRNQLRSWREEIRNILISMGQTVQEFDLNVKVGDTVHIIDWSAFANYTGKITLTIIKVKMIISMFGNDTVAEVNLNKNCWIIIFECMKRSRKAFSKALFISSAEILEQRMVFPGLIVIH